MKKSILFPALALSVGLFSCSQEDLSGNASQSDQPVTVTVQLPDNVAGRASSRYIPSASDDAHQLRCILYVTNSDGSWSERIEKVESEAVGETFSFTFTPQDANDYKCTFWADFINSTDQGTGTGNDKRYTDLYYNTQSLPTVSYNSDMATSGALFNNDDCDAYCGTIPTGGALSVALKRPFVKINFNDTGDLIASASNISISGYQVYGSFNIESNQVSEVTEISCSDIAPADKENDKTWFYNYLFVGNENALPGESLSMTVDNVTKIVNFGGKLTSLTSNTQVNASFDWGLAESDGSITISVDFDSDWIDPNAPKVGDYYYSDGTWSTDYNEEKTVAGVIFAVKGDGTNSAIEGDVIANYSGVEGATDVKAWVVAANDGGSYAFYGGSGTAILPENINSTTGDILGYSNTNLWYAQNSSDYAAVAGAKNYAVSITGTTLNSGWYLPSVGQMLALVDVYAENNNYYQGESLAVKNSLQKLVDNSVAGVVTMSNTYYWTSTGGIGTTGNKTVSAYRVGFHIESNYGRGGLYTDGIANKSQIRPVLTIFE